jgi:hypothetical protein
VVGRSLSKIIFTKAVALTMPVRAPLSKTWLIGMIPVVSAYFFGSRKDMTSLMSSLAPKAIAPCTP